MRIAAAQIACRLGDVAQNTEKLCDYVVRAKRAGAECVVFPEMSDTGYAMSVIRECALPWSEGAVPQLQRAAREQSLGIICGVSERHDSCIYNTQVAIDARGEIAGKYRKAHLFAPVQEHITCTAGTEVIAMPLGEFRCGLSICYDLRFPELYRALAIDHGANLFAVSSAWPFPRVEHLRALAVARAIENQTYLILANRVGHDEGPPFCGTSCIVDPYGVVIASASTHWEELVLADLSLSRVEQVRTAMRVFDDRRPEVYRTKN